MKNFLNKYKKYIIIISLLLIILILSSIIYLVSNISYNTISTILIVINILFAFLLSYNYTKEKKQKGIILGLRFGLIYDLILFILGLILKSFKISSLVYYLLILLSSIFGGIISKNKK